MRIFTMRESNKPGTSLNLFTKYVKARKDDFADEDWPATELKLRFKFAAEDRGRWPELQPPRAPRAGVLDVR